MRTLLKLALAAGALWAVWSFVPLGGRTLDARWRAAPDAAAFATRGLAEIRAWMASPPPPAAGGERQARGGPPSREGRPVEGHTEADRRAVDRLLAERLRE
jgi:hypothetical protein